MLLFCLLHAQIMMALLLIKVFNGVTQSCARHLCGMFIQEAPQSLAISFACFAHPSASGLVNQVVLIVKQQFGDLEGVYNVALSYEIVSTDNRGATFPDVLSACQLVQHV